MIFYEDLPLCMRQTILPMSLISVAAKQSKLEVKLSGDNTLEAICKWDSTLPDCGIIAPSRYGEMALADHSKCAQGVRMSIGNTGTRGHDIARCDTGGRQK
jgi:hypothetical protein